MGLQEIVTAIVTVSAAFGGGAVVTGIVTLLKTYREGKQEDRTGRKQDRTDALGEWRDIHDHDQAQIAGLRDQVAELSRRQDASDRREHDCELRLERFAARLQYVTRKVVELGGKMDDWNPDESALHRPLPKETP